MNNKKEKIGRNDLCPCGSDKKYKHCYLKKDSNCFLKKKEIHYKKEKKVFDFLVETSQEISYCANYDKKGNPIIPLRSQLCLLFVLADILSQFWDIYNDKRNKQSIYFPNWFNDFCLNNNNETFKNDEYIKMFNSNNFYDLRNSLLHFYGIPRESLGINYILAPNDMVIKNTRTKDDPKKIIKQLINNVQKEGKDCKLVRVEEIKKLIWNGSVLMMDIMRKKIKEDPYFHIEAIDRLYKEVKDRGAATVVMKKN